MLSRLTNLHSFLTHSKTVKYPQEDIDRVSAEIKSIGRVSNENSNAMQGINKVLSYMKEYSQSLHIQRCACHALSNLAMQTVVARWIVQQKGFSLIKKALTNFGDDAKLCWLGTSAIWNLARPPTNRALIGTHGVSIILKVLEQHKNKERVTNTAMGALSNLSLSDSLKGLIGSNIDIILSVMEQYIGQCSCTVLTSAAGLVANLSVDDNLAEVFAKGDAIPILLETLKWGQASNEGTLHRNVCAALNNMVSAEFFLDSFLLAEGAEAVTNFLKNTENETYAALLENCMTAVNMDINKPTTTFHLCALHGKLNLIQAFQECSEFRDLNAVDSKNMTALDYAIVGKHVDVIRYLCTCGADKYQENLLEDGEYEEKEKEDINMAIKEGIVVLKTAKKVTYDSVNGSLSHVPSDLCKLIVTYHSNLDALRTLQHSL